MKIFLFLLAVVAVILAVLSGKFLGQNFPKKR